MSERKEQLEEQLIEAKIGLVMAEREKLEREAAKRQAAADYARTFSFFAPVSDGSVNRAIYELDAWSREAPGCDITLLINSPGGSVIDGLALYDFLQELKKRGHHIITKGFGMCASMGGVLLQAGDERVMSPRALLLIHEVSAGAMGTTTQMEDKLKFIERLQSMCLDILADRATIKRATIKRNWKRKDWWLSAEEALKKGFIDRIEE